VTDGAGPGALDGRLRRTDPPPYIDFDLEGPVPRDARHATKLTYQTAIVLHALASGHRWGFEIIDTTGLGAGTVYPILRRLEGAGLVSSSWERVAKAHAAQRPPRRYYRLTGAGNVALRDALARYPGVAAVLGGGAPRPEPA
jgi:hypothetical protein